MRIVVALGGNALLKRGEPMTAQNQSANIRIAAEQLAKIKQDHELVISHGNGPQVGLLALQHAAYHAQDAKIEPYPLTCRRKRLDDYAGRSTLSSRSA